MTFNKIKPKSGQESVWDYPRPPVLVDCHKTIKVIFAGQLIAESSNTKRVLETSHPPTFYIPPEDVRVDLLQPISNTSFCEWKGMARYYDIVVDSKTASAASWCYPEPTRRFESMRNYLAFYPHMMDACFVGDEKVQSQAGGFYGGWITSDIVGPFKGEPGTMGW